MKKKIYVLGAILVCVVCLGIIVFGIKTRNINYDEYLRKTWVAENWRGGNNQYTALFLFEIDKVEEGIIEGRYAGYRYIYEPTFSFSGVIKNGVAECILYKGDGVTPAGELKLVFLESNKIDATIDWYQSSLHKNYIFRPYNLGDIADFRFSKEVVRQAANIDTWGQVNIVAGFIDINKPYPVIYLVNEHDDILYEFEASYQTASEVCEIVVDDFNADGLQDVKIVTYFPKDVAIEKIERIFYQTDNGDFERGNGATDVGSEEGMQGMQDAIYGIWQITDVALMSEMYTGTLSDGDFEENLYDPEEYLGYELEYSQDFFRIGNEVYANPEYITHGLTVKEFNEGGNFRNPDLYSFIEQENIIVDNAAADGGISNVPIVQYQVNFSETVSYGNLDFIPVGTQCVLLNKDTLLIGIWGKVLVAYKS